MYKKYKNEFLPLAIRFYKKLTDENIKFINEQISNSTMKNLRIKTFELKDREELLDYYANDMREYGSLSSGLKMSEFIN